MLFTSATILFLLFFCLICIAVVGLAVWLVVRSCRKTAARKKRLSEMDKMKIDDL